MMPDNTQGFKAMGMLPCYSFTYSFRVQGHIYKIDMSLWVGRSTYGWEYTHIEWRLDIENITDWIKPKRQGEYDSLCVCLSTFDVSIDGKQVMLTKIDWWFL